MYLPPVKPFSNSDIFVSGDVTIHESAVVAPGTILQAAPDSRIVIGAGVCVGMGVILNAYEGIIELEDGAILGAGVLLIGKGKIGNNACIGASSTILNASIDSMAVLPAGSLIGDTSRQIAILPEAESIDLSQPPTPTDEISTLEKENHPEIEADLWTAEAEIETEETSPVEQEIEVQTNSIESEEKTQPSSSPVVGQVYINQLLVTLFPERNQLNRF